MLATDLPGRYPNTSTCGHKHLFVTYEYDTNYIHATPIKSQKLDELIRDFETSYKSLTKNCYWAKTVRLDNKISNDFKHYLPNKDISYQLVSWGDHRTNPAERAARTYKNQFIANLNGADPEFPDNCWDLLIPQVNLTLNLLQSAHMQPQLST